MHPKRPEWGRGVVESAANATFQGKAGQRLTVRFERHKRVTINTAVASLEPCSDRSDLASFAAAADADGRSSTGYVSPRVSPNLNEDAGQSSGWLNQLEKQQQKKGNHPLAELPENMTDPFLSEARRLENTLNSFHYDDAKNPSRALIDWASDQTELDDPMTAYSRHEIEQAWDRFRHLRQQHLKQLVIQMVRADMQAQLHQARSQCRYPAARQALEKLM